MNLLKIPSRIYINTDITTMPEYLKSIIGMCFRNDCESSNVLYISHNITRTLETADMEAFAILWAIQFIKSNQESEKMKESLNLIFLCDSKPVIDILNNVNKSENINKHIFNNLFKLIELMKEKNNIFTFKWIERNKNKLIDSYIDRMKTKYINKINNQKNIRIDNEDISNLIMTTLDSISIIIPQTIRFNYFEKLFTIERSNFSVTLNTDMKIIFNILNYHMTLETLIGNRMTLKHLDFLNNVVSLLTDYNNKIDYILYQSMEKNIVEQKYR